MFFSYPYIHTSLVSQDQPLCGFFPVKSFNLIVEFIANSSTLSPQQHQTQESLRSREEKARKDSDLRHLS